MRIDCTYVCSHTQTTAQILRDKIPLVPLRPHYSPLSIRVRTVRPPEHFAPWLHSAIPCPLCKPRTVLGLLFMNVNVILT